MAGEQGSGFEQMADQVVQGYRPEENTDQRQFTREEVKDTEIQRENKEFFQKISPLMRSKDFAIKVAVACDSAYRGNERKQYSDDNVPEWITTDLLNEDDKSLLLNKPTGDDIDKINQYKGLQEKLAINAAALYALVDGLNILTIVSKRSVKELLQSILDDSVSDQDKDIFSISAHTTWAASQHFRDRAQRSVMMPWAELDDTEKHKDMVQIRAAAEVLSKELAG